MTFSLTEAHFIVGIAGESFARELFEFRETSRAQMLKAMRASYLDELDSALWYVYGRIAEEYGQEEAARNAYARVEKPDGPEVEQNSTYRLSTRRLEKMNSASKASGSAKSTGNN